MNKGAHLFLSIAVGFTFTSGQYFSLNTRAPIVSPPALAIAVSPQSSRNTISGHIFGPNHRPVSDVYVELLTDMYTTITQTKTDASGRYIFNSLYPGNYKVKVLPFGTDYGEQIQDITIINVSVVQGGGTDYVQLDFYLKQRNPSGTASGPLAAPGTVFAQEVPPEAKKFYEQGVENLRDKKEKEGFENLKRSLEIFPNYYLALDRLGTEYVVRGYFEAAYILLTKAVEVNPRSFSSVFGLGLAQYRLGRTSEAIDTLRRATNLYDKSINAHLWLGVVLKKAGKPQEAEAALKRAKELSKGKAAEVHWQLAQLYSEQRRYKEAGDELEIYLKTQQGERDPEKVKQLIKTLREKAAHG